MNCLCLKNNITFVGFSNSGARIILACRNRQRAEATKQEIQIASNSNQIEIELVDISSLESVRECATRLQKRLPRIDVLINNAGR